MRWLSPIAAVAALLLVPASGAAQPLRTGLVDPTEEIFGERDPAGAYAAVRDAGASVVRVPVVWRAVARTAPAAPADPSDPAYDWTSVDRRVRAITSAGMQPLLSFYSTPDFARLGELTPEPVALGAFAGALARRYAGGVVAADGAPLPRIRLFQVWNEPNYRDFLDRKDAPARYRAMLRAATPAIHAVHSSNLVVAGGLSPFAGPDNRYGMAPLAFMRAVLSKPVPFDVWSMHPYTSGPPSRRALNRGDASIGDLPAVRSILRANGHRRTRLWVTEFSWDSQPNDRFAVPLREHGRWVAEGLYRMWRHGVSLVVWFQLRDNLRGGTDDAQRFQSGLYLRTAERYADERAKPALTAFRFPFVALPAPGGVTVWGRTPDGDRRRVVIERRTDGRWRRLTTLSADRDGIFQRRLRGHQGARLRARVGRRASLGFDARPTRNRFVNPFGEVPRAPS